MTDGFLLVDKPAGPTSHDVVTAVRRATGERRVGHAGTLDPFATGLLAVLVGRCTRLAPYLVGLDKTYEGTITLGRVTDTDDHTGATVTEAPVAVSAAALTAAMAALTGVITQVPPDYSAKKVGGRPAHRRARRGETVTLAPQQVTVHEFALTGRDDAAVRFRARVSSGTYLRALARDLGAGLGCGAHLAALRRTAIGDWPVTDALTLETLAASAPVLRPALDAVPHLPRRDLEAQEALAIRHGRAVPDGATEGPIALVADGALLAVATREGTDLHPRVVLAA